MFYYHLFVFILFVLFVGYLIYAGWEFAHHRAPFVPTIGLQKKLVGEELAKLLENKQTPQTIVDAGCGNGSILAELAKKYPQHRFIGIEYNASLYNYCRHRYKKIKNLFFKHQDLLTFDYEETDIIYYFGIPELTLALEKKLLATQKKIDIIALDADFSKLKLIEKKPFRFLVTHSFVYHYKN